MIYKIVRNCIGALSRSPVAPTTRCTGGSVNLKAAAKLSLGLGIIAFPWCSNGPLTRNQFERALNLQQHYRGLIDHLPDAPEWIEGTSRFVYRDTLRATDGEKENGFRFVVVDAGNRSSQSPFDAQRLADSLAKS